MFRGMFHSARSDVLSLCKFSAWTLIFTNLACTVKINNSALVNRDSAPSDDDSNLIPISINATTSRHTDQVQSTSYLPAVFEITFDTDIIPSSLEPIDLTNLGTATGVTWTVESINNRRFIVSAVEATTQGTIIPSISSGSFDAVATYNEFELAATDDGVTYTAPLQLQRMRNNLSIGTAVVGTSTNGKYALLKTWYI